MITVEEALKLIKKNKRELGNSTVPLSEAIGRVLREDLYADRDFPPYDRVTMDGIALSFSSFKSGQRTFPIENIAAAGAAQMSLQLKENCLEVMTGSILPQGVDTVIRYEDLTIENGKATVTLDTIIKGQNIHKKGEDRKMGARVVASGTLISPAEIGIAATLGKSALEVARLPRAIIISTGDELVEIDKKPLPHQIRKSNVHRLKATLTRYKIHADTAHLIDDLDQVKSKLSDIIKQYEVVILSGGVSKGKFDYLPRALNDLGVEKLFHKIRQRPGKPFWFGKAENGTIVFALPGNPVSSFMCTQQYFAYWLHQSLGLGEQVPPHGMLTEDYVFKPDLTYFLQVKITFDKTGRILAKPETGNGSGDLANLSEADAFLQLPRGKDLFKKGELYPLIFYREVI